jgi:hypothetical protein
VPFFFPKNVREAPAVVPEDSKNAAAGAAEVRGDSNHVPAAAAEEFFVSKNSRAAPSLTFFGLYWSTLPPFLEVFALTWTFIHQAWHFVLRSRTTEPNSHRTKRANPYATACFRFVRRRLRTAWRAALH